MTEGSATVLTQRPTLFAAALIASHSPVNQELLMITPHRVFGILLIGLLPALVSCNGKTALASSPQRTCDPTAAQALAGKPRLTDEEAMRLTGANIVRQIKPDQSVTHDFRENRVTIETDPATGRIVRGTCG
jgi:hypothetical protein